MPKATTLIFADEPIVKAGPDRTTRSYVSTCGQCKVVEITSHIDRRRYWLPVFLLGNAETPIRLRHQSKHLLRSRREAELACEAHLAAKGLLDSQPLFTRSDETMTRKTKATKTTQPAKQPKAAKQAKPAKATKAKPPAKHAGEKKLSALDAAAQVLKVNRDPMTAKDMISLMETKGLWKSPGGKTPDATLYAAIIREIANKGKDARFKKTDRGLFAFAG